MADRANDDLADRTKNFAIRTIRLIRALPNTLDGREIGKQLLRSGTSVGANYRAARRGRSKREFVAKLGIVQEEADESLFWLELIIDTKLLPARRVRSLEREANELVAIMAQSIKTAKKNL